MSNNIIINYRKNAIEISKTFSKKASIFDSNEYNQLKEAKKDFPKFRVEIKSASKRKFEDKITMKDIIYYVENHSGKDSSEMKKLKELRGKSVKEANNIFEIEETASFADIKKWFFDTYSELADKTTKRKERIDEILKEAAKNSASV